MDTTPPVEALSVWVGAIRAREEHSPECDYQPPAVNPRSDWDGVPCRCDREARADARLAQVLREALGEAIDRAMLAVGEDPSVVRAVLRADDVTKAVHELADPIYRAALAVVERAAQEGHE